MIVEILCLWWTHTSLKKEETQQGSRDMFVPFEGENSHNHDDPNKQQGDNEETNFYPDDFDEFGDV